MSLAVRQGALGVKIKAGGKELGPLREVLCKRELSSVRQRLADLERFCFDFRRLDRIDLEHLHLPEFVPSTEITVQTEIRRNDRLDQPYFPFIFSQAGATPRELGRVTLIYEPSARALSLYTCGNLQINHGERLQLELIPRAFIGAAQILRALSLPVEHAYAFYILWGDDYSNPEMEIVDPQVQQRIDRVFHVLGQLGFSAGHPANIAQSINPGGAMMIGLDRLEALYGENRWQWTYLQRFGQEWAELLDRDEIEQRLDEAEQAFTRQSALALAHWRGSKEETARLMAGGKTELLRLVADNRVSPALTAEAVHRLVTGFPLGRQDKEELLELFKLSEYPVKALDDERLDRDLWHSLPNGVRYRLLRSERVDWAIKRELFFYFRDLGGLANLKDPAVIGLVNEAVRDFTREQIVELFGLSDKYRNSQVAEVFRRLLNEELARRGGRPE